MVFPPQFVLMPFCSHQVLTSVLMGPTGLVATAKACAETERPISSQTFINLKLAAKALANLCQVFLQLLGPTPTVSSDSEN